MAINQPKQDLEDEVPSGASFTEDDVPPAGAAFLEEDEPFDPNTAYTQWRQNQPPTTQTQDPWSHLGEFHDIERRLTQQSEFSKPSTPAVPSVTTSIEDFESALTYILDTIRDTKGSVKLKLQGEQLSQNIQSASVAQNARESEKLIGNVLRILGNIQTELATSGLGPNVQRTMFRSCNIVKALYINKLQEVLSSQGLSPEELHQRGRAFIGSTPTQGKEPTLKPLKSRFLPPDLVFLRNRAVALQRNKKIPFAQAEADAKAEWPKIQDTINMMVDKYKMNEDQKAILTKRFTTHLLEGGDFDEAVRTLGLQIQAETGTGSENQEFGFSKLEFDPDEYVSVLNELRNTNLYEASLKGLSKEDKAIVGAKLPSVTRGVRALHDLSEKVNEYQEPDREELENVRVASEKLTTNATEILNLSKNYPQDSVAIFEMVFILFKSALELRKQIPGLAQLEQFLQAIHMTEAQKSDVARQGDKDTIIEKQVLTEEESKTKAKQEYAKRKEIAKQYWNLQEEIRQYNKRKELNPNLEELHPLEVYKRKQQARDESIRKAKALGQKPPPPLPDLPSSPPTITEAERASKQSYVQETGEAYYASQREKIKKWNAENPERYKMNDREAKAMQRKEEPFWRLHIWSAENVREAYHKFVAENKQRTEEFAKQLYNLSDDVILKSIPNVDSMTRSEKKEKANEIRDGRMTQMSEGRIKTYSRIKRALTEEYSDNPRYPVVMAFLDQYVSDIYTVVANARDAAKSTVKQSGKTMFSLVKTHCDLMINNLLSKITMFS